MKPVSRLNSKLFPDNVIGDRHVAFCEYNGSVARIICVAVATLANEKLLEHASDNDLLLCRKSTSNKTRYRHWFDRCIISKMILKSVSNWLFPVVFLVEITLSGNSFEFSRLTGFLEVDFLHNKRSLSDACFKRFSFAGVATATQIILATLPLYSQTATWRSSTLTQGKEKKWYGVWWGEKVMFGPPFNWSFVLILYDSEMKVLTDEKRGISYTMLK
jgi:hypothetical protein